MVYSCRLRASPREANTSYESASMKICNHWPCTDLVGPSDNSFPGIASSEDDPHCWQYQGTNCRNLHADSLSKWLGGTVEASRVIHCNTQLISPLLEISILTSRGGSGTLVLEQWHLVTHLTEAPHLALLSLPLHSSSVVYIIYTAIEPCSCTCRDHVLRAYVSRMFITWSNSCLVALYFFTSSV